MTFLELINNSELKDIVEFNNYKKIVNSDYFETLYCNVKEFLNKTTLENQTNLTHLLISVDEDPFYLEKNEDSYYYHVSGYVNNSSSESYGLTFLDWHEYKNLIIDENSLYCLGKEICLCAILYEMSWNGISVEKVYQKNKEDTEALETAIEDLKNGCKTYSVSEVFQELNFESDEERKKLDTEMEYSYYVDSGNKLCSEAIKDCDFKGNEYWNYTLTRKDKALIREFIKSGYYGLKLLKKCQEAFPEKNFNFNHKKFFEE